MSKGSILAFQSNYSKDSDIYRKIIKIYNIVADIGLTNNEIETIIMYIKYGYSRETKKVVEKELKFKNSNYIHVMNHKLKTKGMLVNCEYNKMKKNLSKELQNIKELVNNGNDEKILPIIFKI